MPPAFSLLYFFINLIVLNGQNLPESTTLGSTDTLYLRWKVGNSRLTSCSVRLPNNKTITINDENSINSIKYLGEGLDKGYCGITVSKLIPQEHTGIWTMIAKADGESQNQSTKVTVYPLVEIEDKTIYVHEGEILEITCGCYDPIYCELKKPNGEVSPEDSSKKCHYYTYRTTLEDGGVWSCTYTSRNFIRTQLARVIVHVLEPLKDYDLGYNETDNEIQIFCNSKKTLQRAYSCQIVKPDGEILFLSNGRGTDRYSYLGKEPKDCGVRFSKPLRASETGAWMCKINVDIYPKIINYGGYIHIPPKKQERSITKRSLSIALRPEKEIINVLAGDPLEIIYHADTSLNYCWCQFPNGTLITLEEKDRDTLGIKLAGNGLSFGDCGLKLWKADASHHGQWECGANAANSITLDGGEKVEVIVAESRIVTNTPTVTGTIGSTITLHCASYQKEALEYCQFINTKGKAIRYRYDESDNLTIETHGLTTGSCHHQILITDEDFGSWHCGFLRLKNTEKLYDVSINILPPSGLSLAYSLAIALSSLLIITVVGLIIHVKYIIPKFRAPAREDTIALTEPTTDDGIFYTRSSRRRRNLLPVEITPF